ncbi:hypothetical protein C0W35_22190 [Photobacterium kishitanii]|uniref:hypothetical protein n=1 Tax=Photobacterium kishitanii TaxID=318456 RepID=UPI000D15297C|nr:hypothetical protein [Photobacterium kishitanii]PSU86585.1 hypothetical protein C0W35_22190 [Photobacterium kishitanii]
MKDINRLLILCKEEITLNFNLNNINDALDERDKKPFDSNWVSCYEEIDSKLITHEELKLVNALRKIIFLKCYKENTSEESGELSEYVSDDFELIAKAIITRSENHWVSSLLNEYKKGNFPRGDLKSIPIKINDLLNKPLKMDYI